MTIFESKHSKYSGFSLVELMAVVGIIGVLAALAVPKLQIFMAKAKTTEVKGALNEAYGLMLAWYNENSTFATAVLTAGGNNIGYVANNQQFRV